VFRQVLPHLSRRNSLGPVVKVVLLRRSQTNATRQQASTKHDPGNHLHLAKFSYVEQRTFYPPKPTFTLKINPEKSAK
jgi:hypothetical protein